MNPTTAITTTLVVDKLILVAIGILAALKNQSGTDFYLGGRRLVPWVAALSSLASAASAYTMLGLNGLAFAKDLCAFWFVPACVSGFILNCLVLARRLRQTSDANRSLTLTDLLAADSPASIARLIKIRASILILLSFGIYVASQSQGASKTYQDTVGLYGIWRLLWARPSCSSTPSLVGFGP